jgi:ribosomal-protein-alanine N-acetyltransferase
MNADPEVMGLFPSPLTREESDTFAAAIEARLAADGFGLWAVEIPGVVPFAGFIGLAPVPFEAPFTPAVEIGWRLARAHWGRGYATEGARAVLAFGFEVAGLDEIVSFTSRANVRSQRVMERIGLHSTPVDDFVNPRMPPDHPLGPHVLYRLTRDEWEAFAPSARA